jgi:hypothetical protein
MITVGIIWIVCGIIASILISRDLYKKQGYFTVQDILIPITTLFLGTVGLIMLIFIIYSDEIENFGNKKLF